MGTTHTPIHSHRIRVHRHRQSWGRNYQMGTRRHVLADKVSVTQTPTHGSPQVQYYPKFGCKSVFRHSQQLSTATSYRRIRPNQFSILVRGLVKTWLFLVCAWWGSWARSACSPDEETTIPLSQCSGLIVGCFKASALFLPSPTDPARRVRS